MTFDLVEVEVSPDQKVYVQSDRELRLRPEQIGAQPGFAPAALPKAPEIVEYFEHLAQYASQRSEQFVRWYQNLAPAIRPTKIALEFAIGLEGSAGIPFLAAGKGSANITITAEWASSTPKA